MRGADWLIGVLVTLLLVVTVLLFRGGVGDRKRERDELRRSAKRAEPE